MKSESFVYTNGRLTCEGLDVVDIAAEYGTPLYLYSLAGIKEAAARLKGGLEDCEIAFKYAVKANGNQEIVRIFRELGFGADVVSGGELHLSLRAGVQPSDIVFAGVGKQRWELEYALEQKVGFISIESEWELSQLADLRSRNRGTRYLLRCNPSLDGNTHPYLTTGRAENKFGIPIETVRESFTDWYEKLDGALAGVQFHIGSQILDISAFAAVSEVALAFVRHLQEAGAKMEVLNFGGGVGVRYDSDEPVEWDRYKKIVRDLSRDTALPLILEPGRSLVAECGVALGQVLFCKRGTTRDFIISDLAMNDLIRPALYQAHHEILALYRGARNKEGKPVDVVGPVCESGDFVGKHRELPLLEPGDAIAVLTAGAYGYAMASNYNERPRPAEVLVDGNSTRLIRPRERLF